MKKTNRIISVFLAVAMLFSMAALGFSANAASVANGSAGESAIWTLDSDGTLTVSGTGKITVEYCNPPWLSYNDSIRRIVVEEGITEIPAGTFYCSEKCTSISIPSSVENIHYYAFAMSNGVEKYEVDADNANYKSVDGVIYSKDGKSLLFFPMSYPATEFTIPSSVEYIGNCAFRFNLNLERIVVPDTVKELGESVFTYTKASEIVIGNGITEIKYSTFSHSVVETVIISDSVESIAYGAFWGAQSLKNLVIGKGLKTVENDVLEYTSKLTAIHYTGTQAQWDAIDIDPDNDKLFAKELHFITEGEGYEPTCTEGHGAGLCCEICNVYYTGDSIPAVYPHTLNAESVCENCSYVRKVGATLGIKNNYSMRTISYGDILILAAEVTDKPEGAQVYWYVDGEKVGEGETFEFNYESGTKYVTVILADEDGIVYLGTNGQTLTDSEIITVNAGFFRKLISFFKNLFGISRIIVQSI